MKVACSYLEFGCELNIGDEELFYKYIKKRETSILVLECPPHCRNGS